MITISEYQTRAPTASATQPAENLVTMAFSIGLFSAIFLQRFALHVSGYPVQLVQLTVLGLMIYLLWRRIALVDSARLLGFLALVCVFAIEGLISRGADSLTSLGLLLAIYALNIFVVTVSQENYVRILSSFQRMMVITATLGLTQFFGQFVVPAGWSEYLFSFKDLIPADWLLPAFNTVIPVHQGGSVFKSNGVVFLEPSTFSQFLAVAMIVELAVFHAPWRFAVFAFAYLVTYSGTGLVILAATLPFFLTRLRPGHLLVGAVVLGGVFLAAGAALNLDVFVNRAGSFNNEHSSAFARFVGPWMWIRDVQMTDTWRTFFGYGAGSVAMLQQNASFDFHDPTWAKVTIEYGLIGALAFFSFYLHSVFARAHDKRINWALFVMFLATGGALLNPFMAYTVFLLGILPTRAWPVSPAGVSPEERQPIVTPETPRVMVRGD